MYTKDEAEVVRIVEMNELDFRQLDGSMRTILFTDNNEPFIVTLDTLKEFLES